MARVAKTLKKDAEKAVKATKEKKPRTSYKQRKEARVLKEKVPYDWKKHLSPRHKRILEEQEINNIPEPIYNAPEDHPEYLRASAAVEKDLIFAELDKWIGKFPEALNSLKVETGEIRSEDVMYHLTLISRILKNKYEEKIVMM